MLEVEYLPVEGILPFARNARTHSDAQIAQIAASIKEFGFTSPILIDAEDGIIAGHGRLAAARKLGMTEVPCIRLADLSDTQKRALIIAENRIALNSGWDAELLAVELDELRDACFDLDVLGFERKELNDLIGTPNFAPASEEDQGKLDELAPKYVACPHCGQEFDLRGQG